MQAFGIRALPNWPPESPDLNPQENVWPRIEERLRRDGKLSSFEEFKRGLVKLAKRYPPEGLVASTQKRLRECIPDISVLYAPYFLSLEMAFVLYSRVHEREQFGSKWEVFILEHWRRNQCSKIKLPVFR